MPSFEFVKEFSASESFRNAAIVGKYDLGGFDTKETFKGEIELPTTWNVGLIVGNSGTGKTSIGKEIFPANYISHFDWDINKSILDEMPGDVSVEEISKTLNAVGFSAPTQWIKPYYLLSGGQKMRVDLARAILSKNEMIVFDEFTSVVDRNVAKVGSLAIQKSIRKQNKKFIALSCHFDIEEWLQPDWVFDTNKMEFRTSKKKDQKSLSKSLKQPTNQFGKCLLNIII